MSSVYESIMTGLTEAVEDAQSKDKKLRRRVVTIVPVKEYSASEIQAIRKSTGYRNFWICPFPLLQATRRMPQ